MHDISYRSQLASVYETDRQLYYLLAHCCASGMYHYHAHTHRALLMHEWRAFLALACLIAPCTLAVVALTIAAPATRAPANGDAVAVEGKPPPFPPRRGRTEQLSARVD